MGSAPSLLEMLWTGISTIGLLATAALLSLSIRDEIRRRSLEVNGLLSYWSQAAIVLKGTLLAVFGLFTSMGIIALATPPRPDIDDVQISASVTFSVVALILVNVLLVGLIAHRWLTRNRILQYEEYIQQHREAETSAEAEAGAGAEDA
jgi:hypothetical protein